MSVDGADIEPITARTPVVCSGVAAVPGSRRYIKPLAVAKLDASDKAILGFIVGYFAPGNVHNGREWAYCGIRRIAEGAGMSNETARRRVTALVGRGVLLKVGLMVDGVPHFIDGGCPFGSDQGWPTIWSVDIDALGSVARTTSKRGGLRTRHEHAPYQIQVRPVPDMSTLRTTDGDTTAYQTLVRPPCPELVRPRTRHEYAPVPDMSTQGRIREDQGDVREDLPLTPEGDGGTVPDLVTPARSTQSEVQPQLTLIDATAHGAKKRKPSSPRKRKTTGGGTAVSDVIAVYCEEYKAVNGAKYGMRDGRHKAILTALETHYPDGDQLAWLRSKLPEFFTAARNNPEAKYHGGSDPQGFLDWANTVARGEAWCPVGAVRPNARKPAQTYGAERLIEEATF